MESGTPQADPSGLRPSLESAIRSHWPAKRMDHGQQWSRSTVEKDATAMELRDAQPAAA